MSRPRPVQHRGPSLSRRAVAGAGAASGLALAFGGLLGQWPGLEVARAQEEGSPLYGDLGSAKELIGAAELFERLDRVGSLDVSTGVVSVDPDGLKEVLSDYLSGRRLETAYQGYLRHAELGFAVGGNPDRVARGQDVCVPWSAIESVFGEDPDRFPLDYQFAILADLGLLEVESTDELVDILTSRFPNVPPELGSVASTGGIRAFKQSNIDYGDTVNAMIERARAARDEFVNRNAKCRESVKAVWQDSAVEQALKCRADIKEEQARVKRDILACIRSARVSVHWWGMRTCFDAECTQTIIDYMRAGGNAQSSAAVLGVALSLQIPFWVAVVLAGGLLVWGPAAQAVAGALQDALDRSGGCGGCIDATWLLAVFGIPAVVALPNGC